MKRDWDLIRKLLTDIEEDRDVLAEIPPEPRLADLSWDEYEQQAKEFSAAERRISGHLELLIDNNFIEGLHVSRTSGRFSYSLADPRLTMAGHDLLDTMRSSTVWGSIKSIAKQKGIELTFDGIKMLGTVALKQVIG